MGKQMGHGIRNGVVAFCLVVAACQSSEPPSSAVIPTNPVPEERLQSHFLTMDEDRDGFISRPEYERGRGAIFIALDKDGNFRLTEDELHLTPQAFDKIAGPDRVVEIGELFQSASASFDEIDVNGDKRLSFPEFREFILHFGS